LLFFPKQWEHTPDHANEAASKERSDLAMVSLAWNTANYHFCMVDTAHRTAIIAVA